MGLLGVLWQDGTVSGLVFGDMHWRIVQSDIVEAFIGKPSRVDLKDWHLGDEGVEQVAWVLEAANPCPQWLVLDYANIGDKGATRLAEAIATTKCRIGGHFSGAELRERVANILEVKAMGRIAVLHGVYEGTTIRVT